MLSSSSLARFSRTLWTNAKKDVASSISSIGLPRASLSTVVLTDFEPWQDKIVHKQGDMVDYTAQLFGVEQCHQRGILATSSEGEAIMDHTKKLFERFALSDRYIKQRRFATFPESLDVETAATKANPSLPSTCRPEIGEEKLGTINGVPLEDRMTQYRDYVGSIMKDWYGDKREGKRPSDIVHVSCSGYMSPSPPQTLVSTMGWHQTKVTHAYHRGCYAAFPALRVATGLKATHDLAKTKGRVDVCHTEFLSLHFDPSKNDPGNIITMTLFADGGFMKYSLYSGEEFEAEQSTKPRTGLRILGFHEEIIPDSLSEMTWVPGNFQFDMYLSQKVPDYIQEAIVSFVIRLCENAGLDYHEEKERLVFAVHPGGPRIVDYVRDELGIRDDQIDLGREVLKENGNMSSTTATYIWKAILDNDNIPRGSKVVSIAFGPGLTATGAVFEKV